MIRKIKQVTFTKKAALFVAVLIFAWINLSNAQNNGLNVFQDQDQDGLTDQEELSYGTNPQKADTDDDGYSDGKEVESGYNPLKPAPGDKLIEEDKPEEIAPVVAGESISIEKSDVNLTKKFEEEIMQAKGEEMSLLQKINANPESLGDEEVLSELKNVSLTEEELDKILSETLTSGQKNDEVELVPEEDIKVLEKPEGKDEAEIKEKEKKQIEEYLVAVGYIFVENAPFQMEDKNDLKDKTMSYLTQFSSSVEQGNTDQLAQVRTRSEKIYNQLIKLEVPAALKDHHRTGVSIMYYFLKQDPETLVNEEDPLSMVLMLGKIQSAMDELESLGQEVKVVLAEYGIVTAETEDKPEEETESQKKDKETTTQE